MYNIDFMKVDNYSFLDTDAYNIVSEIRDNGFEEIVIYADPYRPYGNFADPIRISTKYSDYNTPEKLLRFLINHATDAKLKNSADYYYGDNLCETTLIKLNNLNLNVSWDKLFAALLCGIKNNNKYTKRSHNIDRKYDANVTRGALDFFDAFDSIYFYFKDGSYYSLTRDIKNHKISEYQEIIAKYNYYSKKDIEKSNKEEKIINKISAIILSLGAVLLYYGLMYLIGIKFGARGEDLTQYKKDVFLCLPMMLFGVLGPFINTNILTKKVQNSKLKGLLNDVLTLSFPVVFFIGIRRFALAIKNVGMVPLLLKPMENTVSFVIIMIVVLFGYWALTADRKEY